MNNINTLVICRDDYSTVDDWENAIKKAVMVLLNNNYIMTVSYDEKSFGIVKIDYNYADDSYGYPYPYWLSPNEADKIGIK